jgi:uncharacterized protein with PIN domain
LRDRGRTRGSRAGEERQMVGRLIDRYRNARKKIWMLRVADSERMSDARCASCNTPAPRAPAMSRYSEAGLIEHTWQCAGCGHQWITSAKGP